MIYVKGLDFEEKPNYEMIRGKFKAVLMRLHTNRKEEVPLDWKVLREKKRESRRHKNNEKSIGDVDIVKNPSQKLVDQCGMSGVE